MISSHIISINLVNSVETTYIKNLPNIFKKALAFLGQIKPLLIFGLWIGVLCFSKLKLDRFILVCLYLLKLLTPICRLNDRAFFVPRSQVRLFFPLLYYLCLKRLYFPK